MSLHPTALADQLDAATAHAQQMLRDAATMASHLHLVHEIPHPWISDQFTHLADTLTNRQARLCPHVGEAPRVVHAAVWAPGLLVCPDCRWLLTPDPAEDSTCDRCRQPSPLLHPQIVGRGPVLLGYGLCPTCHTDIDTAHQPDRSRRRDRRRDRP